MFDVIDVFDPDALDRLAAYADGPHHTDARLLEPRRPESVSDDAVSVQRARSMRVVDHARSELLAHKPTGGDGIDRVRPAVVLRAARPQHADDLAVDHHRPA